MSCVGQIIFTCFSNFNRLREYLFLFLLLLFELLWIHCYTVYNHDNQVWTEPSWPELVDERKKKLIKKYCVLIGHTFQATELHVIIWINETKIEVSIEMKRASNVVSMLAEWLAVACWPARFRIPFSQFSQRFFLMLYFYV